MYAAVCSIEDDHVYQRDGGSHHRLMVQAITRKLMIGVASPQELMRCERVGRESSRKRRVEYHSWKAGRVSIQAGLIVWMM